MSSIYFSSSSPLAETFSHKIARQSESFLEAECKVSNYNHDISKQRRKSEIESCDVLIVVVCSDSSQTEDDISAYNLIDNEQIRFEIISAINQDILIIPILIDDAKLPEKDNVPGALIKLLYFRSLQQRTIFWSENMEEN